MDDVRRRYRRLHGGGDLVFFTVRVGQSDLSIGAARPLPGPARSALLAARKEVEAEIALNPAFATALVPLPPRQGCPPVVLAMARAGAVAGVGPMAAVAGAIAQAVGRALRTHTPRVIVENGGDLYLLTDTPRRVAVWAGDSPLSGRVALIVPPGEWGLCTSAGQVGPSLSLGRAHAAVVLAHDAALADAAATALGNRVRSAQDLEGAVAWARSLPGVEGALAVLNDRLAAAGALELAANENEREP